MTGETCRHRMRQLFFISVGAALLYCVYLEGSLLPLIRRVVSALLSLDGNAGAL